MPFDRNFPLVAGLAFGGFGLLMVAVAALLLARGERDGLWAGAFGLVFCGAGFTVWRVFTPRKNRWGLPVSGWGDGGGAVAQDGTTASGLMLGFTIAFNAIGWGVAAIFLPDDPSAWPVLVFPAFGVGLAVAVVRARLRRRKFGVSVLECGSARVRPGERFRGTVETGVPLRGRSGLDFKVRLACVRRSTHDERVDGRTEQRVSEEVLWKHEETVRGLISSRGPTFQLPLDLAIPEGLPLTPYLSEDDRTLWRVTLHAPDPGVDYAASFELPV